VGEKAEKVLLGLSKIFPTPGLPIVLQKNFASELRGASSVLNTGELDFILGDYLTGEMGFLTSGTMKISPKGWAHLNALQQTNAASQQSFIAMWFDEQVNEAWKAIDQGIRAAGYSPLRIDQKQHNNEITDEMIAEIRKSRFLVADLTGHRQNVYYEAGFAKGFGIEVVWLCRKDQLSEARFDTNHFPIIPWEADKLTELTKALQVRIEASLGRGPSTASA
jgi:nucleoside 2-deoxyribosyltransferase